MAAMKATTSPQRVDQLDLIRGLAVVLMIVGHTIDAVLWAPARDTLVFRSYEFTRGFTAPLFLVVSGFAFSVVSERHWSRCLTAGPLLGRRLSRIILLLVVGYALHLPYLSLEKLVFDASNYDLQAFFQADVLQCFAVGLLTLQLVLMVSRRPLVFAVASALLGAATVFATPWVWSIDFAGTVPAAVTPYLNTRQLTLFPVFPFLGHLFAGAAVGHWYTSARAAGTAERWLRHLLVTATALVIGGAVVGLLPFELYPPHDFWRANPSITLLRLGVVLLIICAIFALRWRRPLLTDIAGLLGRSSLLIYTAHLIVVYGSAVSLGFAQRIGRTLPAPSTLALALAVVAAMAALAWLLDYLRRDFCLLFRLGQAGFGSTLVYLFVTKPY
jgi:uncharacterized membrane protein